MFSIGICYVMYNFVFCAASDQNFTFGALLRILHQPFNACQTEFILFNFNKLDLCALIYGHRSITCYENTQNRIRQ